MADYINSSKLKLSVVICTYNRCELLKMNLDGLINQNLKASFEIIVVDNNSTDNTKELVNDYILKYKNIKYIFEQQIGLSAARNTGFKNANSEYVAYLDDDAIPEPYWVQEIIKFIENMPEIVAFGGPYDRFSLKPIPKWIPDSYGIGYLGDNIRKLDTTKEWLTGLNMIFKKSIFEKVGGFSLSLGPVGYKPLYGDETEMFIRIHNLGYDIYYVPTIKVKHLVMNHKLKLRWHFKAAYGTGITSIESFDEKISFKNIRIEFYRSLRKALKILFKTNHKPFKRKLYYALIDFFKVLGRFKQFCK